MMHLLYNIFIKLYFVIIWLFSLINSKAKLWIDGRKNWKQPLSKAIPRGKSIIWIHCASLGEFEQGRPIIEAIKVKFPEKFILLTFFSPSGFEVRKNYPLADYVCYLPIDSRKNATTFVEIVKPELVIFVKYEYWFNYLIYLKQKSVKTIFVSAIFNVKHYFFKWYGKWLLKQVKNIDYFFVQDKTSEIILKRNNITNVIVAGDTRFDRVLEISKTKNADSIIEDFAFGKKLFIAGSTWLDDELLLLKCIDFLITNNLKLVIAPHEVDRNNIERLLTQWSIHKPQLYSNGNSNILSSSNLLIIDSIGKLMHIYSFGYMAYIGGGFGKGIHNILEPAAFGLPIAFAGNYFKFREAKELIESKGAFCVETQEELEHFVLLCLDTENYQTKTMICRNYIKENVGATKKILDMI